ncbi:MAG: MATE family efflux transporter [Bacillota bacterium]|nr:MATE family efflux transporter [Bacillota bacterium]
MISNEQKAETDMTNGPLFGKIISFALPLMATGMLQIAFNAADIIVLGRCAGSDALAAVGATTNLIYLLINLFIGISIGAAVAISHAIGAGHEKTAGEHAHNAIASALVMGVAVGILGIIFARPMLSAMHTPDQIIDMSVLYFRIYFSGSPVILLYNYGSTIMRTTGDTRRPLIYLALGGVLNVFLNLYFVIEFHLDVAGVGIATVLSNCISALLVLRALTKMPNCCRIELKKVRLNKDKFIQIIKYGLPAGIQSTLFSISNVLIQSSINGFGALAVAGNSAAVSVEALISTGIDSFNTTALTFTGHNVGAGKYKRVSKVFIYSSIGVVIMSLVCSSAVYFFRRPLLTFYLPDSPESIKYGLIRMSYLIMPEFISGFMQVFTGLLRGMGKSILPMITTCFGVCILRIIWIYTVFRIPEYHTLGCIYISYPITWFITAAINGICFTYCYKQLFKKDVLLEV